MRSRRMGTIGIPAAIVTIVVMMVVPMPSFVLDVLITANITMAIIVLIMSMHVQRPLDFSVFPSLLLVATMFRLALNVSATRLVLLHAYAGTVIQSFGHFVVGQSIVVGLVVFLILIIIQFVVITNGSGRVAEVAARFTLDAMPGKQMAIDADLNSGLIDSAEARRRRAEVGDEADFYGAMDGASKFVKGDAMAAVVITAVNLIGGFVVGVVEHHMPIGQAADTYSLLSVGDGLVSQIPALLLSISTGLVVTRAASENDFGSSLVAQFSSQHRAVRMAGAIIAIVGLVPGLPTLAFLVVGGGIFLVGLKAKHGLVDKLELQATPAVDGEDGSGTDVAAELTPQSLAREMRAEPLELELAFDLIDLVDRSRGGDLLDRVQGLRRKVASELGFVFPAVRTRDNLSLAASKYVIRLHGVEVVRGEAPPGKILVIGNKLDELPGVETNEPVFGLPARWVPMEMRHLAASGARTVVDRSSVIATHLGEVVAANAGRLLSRQQVQSLIEVARGTDPVVVDEMAGVPLSLGEVQKVLCGLLDEGVSIKSLVPILEAITERARQNKSPEALMEAARKAIGPAISAKYQTDGRMHVITLDGVLEQTLSEAVRTAEDGSVLACDPVVAETVVTEVARLSTTAEEAGQVPVLVCSARLRPALWRLLKPLLPRLGVLSVEELGNRAVLERVGEVSLARVAV